ncbi:MAG: SAM-dependent methyltransferase [Armatimonadetes bacterium]|nr:SAM-dependent methyltransferase [Armatimonadota bacterium]
MSERKTENLLEQAFRKSGFIDNDFHFQGSLDDEIQRCLPSKRNGTAGKGRPEHLIRLNGDAADILVTECKASKTDHASTPNLTEHCALKPTKYAEDGVLHYLIGLRKEFNVIGLAVSGTVDLQITTFKALRGGGIERLQTNTVLTRDDYLAILRNSQGYGEKNAAEINTFARELHEYLRDHMELSEAFKPLIVSGILLGLKDAAFERQYRDIADKDDLAAALYEAIRRSLKKAKVKDDKFEAMVSNYGFITTNKSVKEYLKPAVGMLYRHLFFALQPNSSFDLLGNFYGEFLRYSGGDQQGLGIVLTPRHITELFADLADLNPHESVVLDVCAGTAGFLIAAMAHMIGKAGGDSRVANRIRKEGLVGIELDPHMFTLACANMIFRGDGKANMYWDDCLKPREIETEVQIRKLKPNVAMLNPPYSKKSKDKQELRFVQRALELLQPNSTAIAIVPVGCLIDDSKETRQAKKEILDKHTLKAAMSMPPQLFPKIGTVTAIVVLEAHKPHYRIIKDANSLEQKLPRMETWFGYWRDDGLMMSKNKRIERKPGLWAEVKKDWLESYFNQRVIPGKSCKRAVSYRDEWVAEAYMETDYSLLDRADFEREVKRFALYTLMLDVQANAVIEEECADDAC